MRKVAILQLFKIDVVIDVDGFFSHVATKLLDEFTGHISSPKIGAESIPRGLDADKKNLTS